MADEVDILCSVQFQAQPKLSLLMFTHEEDKLVPSSSLSSAHCAQALVPVIHCIMVEFVRQEDFKRGENCFGFPSNPSCSVVWC